MPRTAKARKSYPQRGQALRERDMMRTNMQYQRALNSMYDPNNTYYSSQARFYMRDNPNSNWLIHGREAHTDFALNKSRLREGQLKRAYQNRINAIKSAPTRNSAASIKAQGLSVG